MKRISTDAEYLTDGTVTVDADGIPITISGKADQSVITGATHEVGRADAVRANRLVKLDKNGDLFIATNSIIKDSDPVNKVYVDRVVPIPAFAGRGSPEGRVTAPVGTIYTDTAATNGAIRWIKSSGTGATGWRVEYGDTGWRNVRSAISPAPTTGVFNVIRNTASVTLHFDVLPIDGTSSFAQFPFLLPAGFRPLTTVHMPASPLGSGDAVGPIRVQSNGTVTIYGASGKKQVIGLVAFPAEKTWPTSLPGTPL